MNKFIEYFSNKHKGYIIFIELALLLFLGYTSTLIVDPLWRNHLFLMHSIFELICILIIFSTFIVTWNTYGKNSYFNRVIGLLFLAVAIIDILHTFYYQTDLFRYYYCKYITSEFWMFGRMIEILLLLIVVLRFQSLKMNRHKTLTVLVLAVFAASLFMFPFSYGLHSGMKASQIIIELIIVLMLLTATAVLIIYRNTSSKNYRYLFIAVLFAGMNEFNFTMYNNNSNPFYPEIGHFLRIIYCIYLFRGVFANVAEFPYKKMESALNLSENLFKIAFDNAPIGMGIVSVEGKWENVNNALCELLGYSRDELLQKKYDDTLCNSTIDVFYQIIDKLMYGNLKSYSYEKNYYLVSGKSVWAQLNISLVKDADGKPLYLVVQVEDISDRKKAEELTILSIKNEALVKEAMELERLRTDFFTNLSHELRTPLNVIHSALQLIELNMNNCEISSEKIEPHVKVMKQNCMRLLRLINNLIDITRIDAGFFQLNLGNYNIVSIVEGITMSVAEYVKSKGIELIFDTDIEEKIIVCDPDKIERIILNIISNSLKFTDKGGVITVDICDREDSIQIVIEDTGIGIPEDKVELIFERFRQVDNSTTRNNEGSGIGLSIVKSLVEMHSGTVSLESKLGEGCKVIVSLPSIVKDDENLAPVHAASTIQSNHIDRINVEFSDIYFKDR